MLAILARGHTGVVATALPLLNRCGERDGFQRTVYGCLQGLQNTQVFTLLNVLGYWSVGLSVGYMLDFQLQIGGKGLWIGQPVRSPLSRFVHLADLAIDQKTANGSQLNC